MSLLARNLDALRRFLCQCRPGSFVRLPSAGRPAGPYWSMMASPTCVVIGRLLASVLWYLFHRILAQTGKQKQKLQIHLSLSSELVHNLRHIVRQSNSEV